MNARQAAEMQADQTQMVAQTAVNMAFKMEQNLDAELNAMENLGQSDFMKLRQKRLEQLKKKQEMMQTWKRQGHGQYQELGDEKEWFNESKTNERMVCHFYRGTTWRCEIVDKHMAKIAPKHMETRFVKIDAEKCPFLAERLNIVLMPTIVCTIDNKVADTIEGFDSLGGKDNFTTEDFERRIAEKGAIEYEGDIKKRLDASKSRKSNSQNPKGNSIYGATRKFYDSDED